MKKYVLVLLAALAAALWGHTRTVDAAGTQVPGAGVWKTANVKAVCPTTVLKSGAQTCDGVTVGMGTSALIPDGLDGGVWIVDVPWRRRADYNVNGNVTPGSRFAVTDGTQWKNTDWYLVSVNAGLGSSWQHFEPMRTEFDVTRFGVDSKGITDNTAQIQAAFNAAIQAADVATGRGDNATVVFPSGGKYRITSTINTVAYSTFHAKHIYVRATGAKLVFEGTGGAHMFNASGTALDSATFDGGEWVSASNSAGWGLYADVYGSGSPVHARDITFSNVTSSNRWGGLLYYRGAIGSTIENIRAHVCYVKGISLNDYSNATTIIKPDLWGDPWPGAALHGTVNSIEILSSGATLIDADIGAQNSEAYLTIENSYVNMSGGHLEGNLDRVPGDPLNDSLPATAYGVLVRGVSHLTFTSVSGGSYGIGVSGETPGSVKSVTLESVYSNGAVVFGAGADQGVVRDSRIGSFTDQATGYCNSLFGTVNYGGIRLKDRDCQNTVAGIRYKTVYADAGPDATPDSGLYELVVDPNSNNALVTTLDSEVTVRFVAPVVCSQTLADGGTANAPNYYQLHFPFMIQLTWYAGVTIHWPGNIKWAGGSAPTVPGSSVIDFMSCEYWCYPGRYYCTYTRS